MSNKKIWITGASSGIGKELALQYARAGHTVFASARNTTKLEALAQTPNLAGAIIPSPLDVTDTNAVETFCAAMTENNLPDLAIFNAGFYEPIGIDDLNLAHFKQVNDVNYLGVVRCLCGLLPHYRKSRTGHLAIMASVAGYAGLPQAAAYGSSKAALINLAESLKPELESCNVAMSVINPGFVATPMTDKNRFSMPFKITPQKAAERIIDGLDAGKFEISFPRRFTWLMKLIGILPYWLFFKITRPLVDSKN